MLFACYGDWEPEFTGFDHRASTAHHPAEIKGSEALKANDMRPTRSDAGRHFFCCCPRWFWTRRSGKGGRSGFGCRPLGSGPLI